MEAAEEEERSSGSEEDEAAQGTDLEQLQSEVAKLRGQLVELELEKEALMKQTRIMEDRQVTNWKWIHEATKFSGISVNKCSDKACTFHFHPMYKSRNYQTYAMTVKFTNKGYEVDECFLPESIHMSDMDETKPLDRLVWDISILVDSFVNRQQQIKELENEFGTSVDRTVTFSEDTLKVLVRVRVSDENSKSFIIRIQLNYQPSEILPEKVILEFEDGQDYTEVDVTDFEMHCHPFYRLPILRAFHEAF
ncbi:uncharacterized protein LOC116930083 [Daphnia magna]|uniref:uncharacterized protein LOC116930083 n=1 Tax=Daphnia magna TaxID=35525 RepID=UPI00140322A0|nr:uncharacterized protein LOC116930083 [Daphnia magna]XP_032793341.1 uncharacterized protein LOC116930083 [Daphnia magna]XP_032793343.1 uncharacterized protein LOC116930083 [Daphnia magna]XP_032793344.1 uncharacterized protein LOC116930083 [Daphnia magna]